MLAHRQIPGHLQHSHHISALSVEQINTLQPQARTLSKSSSPAYLTPSHHSKTMSTLTRSPTTSQYSSSPSFSPHMLYSPPTSPDLPSSSIVPKMASPPSPVSPSSISSPHPPSSIAQRKLSSASVQRQLGLDSLQWADLRVRTPLMLTFRSLS